MSVAAVLRTLREGAIPDPDALASFAGGLADGSVSDAQAGAFAMGVCLGPGLGAAGRVALTRAMTDSGTVLDWTLPGPVLDKHSTGGVGDPVSLVLAPALAAIGCYVPMVSGRGLGHTGGTLDKLEAIPGLSVEADATRLRDLVTETGCAIVAAGPTLAPADKRLYAVRDVTATIDQIDLIAASILSKKLAAGIDALVLDVKVGGGAFMQSSEAAETLARALVDTARGAGCRAAALVTGMDEPLAPALGNAIEVRAVLDVLTGEVRDGPLEEVAIALGAELLALAGVVGDAAEGRSRLSEGLRSGVVAERFARMIAAQGGPRDFLEKPGTYLPRAPIVRPVRAGGAGLVRAIDARRLGEIVVALGGGRRRETDAIDPSVGLDRVARVGDRVAGGDVLLRVHAADEAAADRAVRDAADAIEIGPDAVAERPLVRSRVG